LLKNSVSQTSTRPEITKSATKNKPTVASSIKAELNCEMCSNPIEGQPHVEIIGEKTHNFDCRECAQTFKKLKSVYGESFQ
jgi:hypothetical protein